MITRLRSYMAMGTSPSPPSSRLLRALRARVPVRTRAPRFEVAVHVWELRVGWVRDAKDVLVCKK